MTLITSPHLIQMAFNEVWVQTQDQMTTHVDLYNPESQSFIPLDLSRESMNGLTSFNLSGFLRGLFYDLTVYRKTSAGLLWLRDNYRLFTIYMVEGSGYLFVLNGVCHRGESLDLFSGQRNVLLTERKPEPSGANLLYRICRYKGYPYGMCVQYGRAFFVSSEIRVMQGGAAVDEFQIGNRDSAPVYDMYFDIKDFAQSDDIDSIECISSSPDSPRMIISIADECIPDYPVYLRWVNRLGGYEYWMFSGRKSFREEVKRGESYWLGDGQGIDSTATRGELPPAVDNTIACGAEQLDEDDFNMLKGIFLSPHVEMYNTERKVFERVILKDSAAEWDTANSRGVIDIEFSPIDQPIQF